MTTSRRTFVIVEAQPPGRNPGVRPRTTEALKSEFYASNAPLSLHPSSPRSAVILAVKGDWLGTEVALWSDGVATN